MIRMVIGLPGGGKTYYLVTKIIEELRYTDRHIVTNCQELLLPRLREYLQEMDPDRAEPIDLDERLTIIDKEDTFRFYRFRSGGLVLPPMRENGEDGKKLKREAFMAGVVDYFRPIVERPEWSKPVSYFITEAHDYFNAQDWQEVGRGAQYYATKHRHLHDELVLETQLVEQCDASMRRLVEQTHEIENHYQRSFGLFSARGCFKRRVFFKMKGPSSVPYETSEFRLDAKGYGSCYETTGALGLMDRGAESKGFGRTKKLPWWTMWIGAAAVLALVLGGLWMLPSAIAAGMGAISGGVKDGMGKMVDPGGVSRGEVQEVGDVVAAGDAGEGPGWSVVGYVVNDSGPMVFLSDGRILTRGDGALERVGRWSVQIDGREYDLPRAVVRSVDDRGIQDPDTEKRWK